MYSDAVNTVMIKNKWINGKNKTKKQRPIIYSGL